MNLDILPKDKLQLKRIHAIIKRTSESGILFIGTDTARLALAFQAYLTTDNTILFDIKASKKQQRPNEILRPIVFNKFDAFKKEYFYIVNIFQENLLDDETQHDIVHHMQFNRDIIYRYGLKLIVILPIDTLEYLKIYGSDLHSTAKFSYNFIDHAIPNMPSVIKDEKLKKRISEYEAYLKNDVQHDTILYDLSFAVGQEAYDISDFSTALEYWQKALTFADSQSKQANTLGNIGLVYHNLGQLNKALEYHQQSLVIKNELGSQSAEAITLGNIGSVYYSLGQWDKALEYHQQSLMIEKELGSRSGEADTLGNIGLVYYSLGQLDKALEYHQQSLSIRKKLGSRSGEANSLGNIGLVYYSLGQLDKALEYLQQSLSIKKELGSRSSEADTLGNIGMVYHRLDKLDKALEYHQQSLAIEKELGRRSGEANSMDNIGLVYNDLGQLDKALEYHQEALKIAHQSGYIHFEAQIHKNLAVTYQKQHDLQNAKIHYNKAQHIYEAMNLEKKAEEIGQSLSNLNNFE
jgi:tetratricopeptide (TPR) repeat protein